MGPVIIEYQMAMSIAAPTSIGAKVNVQGSTVLASKVLHMPRHRHYSTLVSADMGTHFRMHPIEIVTSTHPILGVLGSLAFSFSF